jgi:hypothetical protein
MLARACAIPPHPSLHLSVHTHLLVRVRGCVRTSGHARAPASACVSMENSSPWKAKDNVYRNRIIVSQSEDQTCFCIHGSDAYTPGVKQAQLAAHTWSTTHSGLQTHKTAGLSVHALVRVRHATPNPSHKKKRRGAYRTSAVESWTRTLTVSGRSTPNSVNTPRGSRTARAR